PVEPYIINGHLLVGVMSRSGKAVDLRRDPRYVLHSTVTGPDGGEGELKLHGLVVVAEPSLRRNAREGWWSAQPPGKAVVFVLSTARALFVKWAFEHDQMPVPPWPPQPDYRHATRSYP